MRRVYLDNAATTPLDQKVIQAMVEWDKKNYGNPSSTHYFGQMAKVKIEEARGSLAQIIGCSAG